MLADKLKTQIGHRMNEAVNDAFTLAWPQILDEFRKEAYARFHAYVMEIAVVDGTSGETWLAFDLGELVKETIAEAADSDDGKYLLEAAAHFEKLAKQMRAEGKRLTA